MWMARQSHNCWCPQCGLRLQDVVSGGNERVLGHQQESSCPKPQYCHTVPQEYEGVQQRWSQVPLSWQGSGNPEGQKGTSLHSVFLADDSHGQQPWFLNTKDMRSINKRNEDFLGNNKLGAGRVRIPTYSHLWSQVKRLVFSSHPGFALR